MWRDGDNDGAAALLLDDDGQKLSKANSSQSSVVFDECNAKATSRK